jgi:hypothetical protein
MTITWPYLELWELYHRQPGGPKCRFPLIIDFSQKFSPVRLSAPPAHFLIQCWIKVAFKKCVLFKKCVFCMQSVFSPIERKISSEAPEYDPGSKNSILGKTYDFSSEKALNFWLKNVGTLFGVYSSARFFISSSLFSPPFLGSAQPTKISLRLFAKSWVRLYLGLGLGWLRPRLRDLNLQDYPFSKDIVEKITGFKCKNFIFFLTKTVILSLE